MIRVWLVGCAVLALGCASPANTGGDAGPAPDADVCETATCECSVDEDCAEHETCDSSGEGRICVCVAAYEDLGSGCEFAGAPLVPGFDDAGPWTTSGGAVLDSAAAGVDDPGVVTWVGENALCDASGVSQTFTMPPYSAAEPLALELTYFGESDFEEAEALVAINEKWARYPATSDFSTITTCLGESAFGGDIEFRIDGQTDFCPADLELIVDRMEVVRADDAGIECPEPGMVRDGDFDGDGTAWSLLNDATVEDGIGQGGSRAGRLQTQKLCQGAALTGLASWPLNSTLANPALRFFWSGTTGRVLEVSAGGFRLARLSAITTPRTSTVCLPPSSLGRGETISFAVPRTSGMCATDDVRDFMVDSIEIVSAPDCEDDPYLVDGDFELALTNTVSTGWATFYREPNGTAGVDTRDAQSGSAALRLMRRQDCAIISAHATFVVPKPDAAGGPALKYFYRVGDNPQTDTSSTPGNGVLPEGGNVFREEIVCLSPADATKPQTLSFTMSPGPAPCTFTYPDEEAFIDNVRLTTDPACPSE